MEADGQPVAPGIRPDAWRGEIAQRMEAYRVRRRKLAPNAAQSKLPFEGYAETPGSSVAVAALPACEEEFSFTIAIGRPSKKRQDEETRMVIDVSLPPDPSVSSASLPAEEHHQPQPGLYPVASIEERRMAGVVDGVCLLFVYGGFLALFNSLGVQFSLNKLSTAVHVATFAIVYLQYFALFTVFGGTTPGMMLRGLQVVSFSAETPTPRQMLLRTIGYLLSAGTFFMGFLWAMWDEDTLTWHDRMSQTYLTSTELFADIEKSSVVPSR